MGKLGSELKWWDQSSSSTILLDPAALVESCKREIQGKDGISSEQQRLIFACRVDNQEILSYTCKGRITSPKAEECAASEFLEELGSWEAILKDEKHAIAKLLNPLVETEDQISAEDGKVASSLTSHTARELRSMGIPCNVYYLFFNKWMMPTSPENRKYCKASSDLNIQIDADFQTSSFEVLLFGRLNGTNLPRPFIYRMNGGEVVTKVSMLEQMVQYRQGQKTRHRLRLSSRSGSKVTEVRDGRAVGENDGSGFSSGSERVDDYYCSFGKDLEFTLIISGDHQLKCFVLTVIQVPASASRKPEQQLVANLHGGCERGVPGSLHDPDVYRMPSSGATPFKCESSSTIRENEVGNTDSLATPCDLAKEDSLLPSSCGLSCSSSVLSSSEGIKSPQNSDISSQHVPGGVETSSSMECLAVLKESIGNLPKPKKRRKGKRNGRLGRGKGADVAVAEDTDCFPPTSAAAAALQSSSPPSKADRNSDLFDIPNCLVIGASKLASLNTLDSSISKESVRSLPLTDEKRKNEPEGVRCECVCSRSITENTHSITLAQPNTIGSESVLKGSSFLDVSSEGSSPRRIIALSKETEEERISTKKVMSNVEDDHLLGGNGGEPLLGRPSLGSSEVLTESRKSCGPQSPHLGPSTRPCTSKCCSQSSGPRRLSISHSRPFLGALLVDIGRQDSLLQGSSSSGGSEGGLQQYPLKEREREPPKDPEACKGVKEHFRLPDANISARGGHNSSGAGSRNGRSGAGDSGGSSRSHGKGSEGRKGRSGYSGAGQGSSGSNHGSGPGGGSSTGGGSGGGSGGGGGGGGGSGSGGSGGGNGNGKGGSGNSGGGSWDRCHVDDDGGNGNSEGDNDGKHRTSFQAETKGEAAVDSPSLQRQNGGGGPLDCPSGHERKVLTGSATQHGDPFANGSCGGPQSKNFPTALPQLNGSRIHDDVSTSTVSGADAETPVLSAGNVEHANLKSLLPREKMVDSASAQAMQSPVTDNCESEKPKVPGAKEGDRSSDGPSSNDRNVTVNVTVLSAAEEETRRVAMEVLDAVRVSCKDRWAAQNIVFEVGHPMAEFEKVLGAVSPSFCYPATCSGSSSGLLNLNTHSDRKGEVRFDEHPTFSQTCMADGLSIAKSRLSGLPLSSIWQWYEEPSHYGAEVRAVDWKNKDEEAFLAYFVPYISALQLFGYPLEAGTNGPDSVVATEGKTEGRMAYQPKILSTLLPSPGKLDVSTSLSRTKYFTVEQTTDSECKDTGHSGLQLLYEFYDSDPPQVRQPLFMKMKELLKGAPSFNTHGRGDPTVLEGLCLGDIHPASWFAVAWYPIYRISEGPLRAVFLTYHSFNHFAPRSSLFSLMGEPRTSADASVSLPVVGLECYNVQGEHWLDMEDDFSKAIEKMTKKLFGDPGQCLEDRKESLQRAAAVMARGIPVGKSALLADNGQSYIFKHPDYQFFFKRRR